MSNFAYLLETDNEITPEVVLSIRDFDTDFPDTNLITLPVSKPCIVNRISARSLAFSFPIVTSLSVIAVLNHNFSPNATIQLRGGTVANPDGSQFSVTIPWALRNCFKLFTAESYQYWALYVDDPENRDGFLRIGLIRAGVETTPTFKFQYGWVRARRYEAIRLRTEFGTPHVSHLFDETDNEMSFGPLVAADAAQLSAVMDTLRGDEKPALLIPTTDGTECFFGRFISGNVETRERYTYTKHVFREDGPGKTAVEEDPLYLVAGDIAEDKGGVFARAGTANYINSYLGQTTAASGELRNKHYTSRSSRTILVEAARTNSFLRSEEFTDAGWTKVNVNTTGNAVYAPDGELSADKVYEDTTATANHVIGQTVSGTANTDQAVSVYAAPGERTWMYIRTFSKAGTTLRSWINLATGNLGTIAAGHTVRIRSVENSFHYIELVWNMESGANTPTVFFGLATADAVFSYTGNGTSGIYLWGAQYEIDGLFSTSYVRTTSAAVARVKDVLYFPINATPTALTAYIRFVERGTLASLQVPLSIGSAAAYVGGPVIRIIASGGFYAGHMYSGGAESESTLAAAPAVGDIVELRLTMNESGQINIYQTINDGGETSGTQGTAVGLPTSWEDDRIYVGGWGETTGYTAFQAIKIARGIQTRATMRGIIA